MPKISDSSVVTRQQLYDMGLSIPLVDKAWEKLPKVYAGNSRHKRNERVIFQDFQEIWCNEFKGVWIETTPTRPLRKYVKPLSMKEVMSFRKGMMYYSICNILKYRPRLSYRRIRFLFYYMYLSKTLMFWQQRLRREYPVAFGTEINHLIKQALKDLVEMGYISYYVPVPKVNASKYYFCVKGVEFPTTQGTRRLVRSYRGRYSTEEFQHLCLLAAYMTKAPQMWEYRCRWKMKMDVFRRIFYNPEKANKVAEILSEFTEVEGWN